MIVIVKHGLCHNKVLFSDILFRLVIFCAAKCRKCLSGRLLLRTCTFRMPLAVEYTKVKMLFLAYLVLGYGGG